LLTGAGFFIYGILIDYLWLFDHDRLRPPAIALGVLVTFGFVWLCCTAPVIASNRPLKGTESRPRRRRALLIILPLSPGLVLSLATLLGIVDVSGHRTSEGLVIPCGLSMFFLLWGVVFSMWINHRCKHACFRARICFDCGYDLRASPGAHCPECGTTIPWRTPDHEPNARP